MMPNLRKAKKASMAGKTDDYWVQSVQPLNCLLFIMPLLLLYEVGVVWLGPAAMRNGADVWLREFLGWLGFGEYVFLPVVTCGFLFGCHHLSRQEWKFRSDVLSGMVCESFGFGVLVLIVAQLFMHLAPSMFHPNDIETAMLGGESMTNVPRMLSYLGAGIYEELLFRFILLSGTMVLCKKLGVGTATAMGFAVLSTSLLFAAAHYRLFFQVGLDFTWYSFAFRMLAGALFSVLFLRRGFGIVVGTHAVYDILVATIAR